jgi:hypothetical protein
MVAILPCTCVNKFQDKEYGTGKRAFNECLKDKWRCTVCGREQNTTYVPKQETSKKDTKSKKKSN